MEWFGQAGHFIAADSCLWHLHTHVNGYCISSVGEYHPRSERGSAAGQMMPIGSERFYETLVFKITAAGIPSSDEIDGIGSTGRDEAQREHMAMVAKYQAVRS